MEAVAKPAVIAVVLRRAVAPELGVIRPVILA
jgi:hypothetical protein